MTGTGESDKEIKSMAFTPCSFLLLFRKYFFMTTSVNGKLEMNIEQKTGQYKNQKLNKNVTVCSITLTPGLWLIIGYIDGNISSDFIYNNTLFDQTVRESMIGGGGSINVILRGIDTTTTVNLSTYDFVNVTSDLTYRGTLAAICLKPYL
jgi:hypothetical protein